MTNPSYPLASEDVRGTYASPEQRLIAAVLARAILDVTGNNRVTSKRQHFRSSYLWIFAKNLPSPMSFEWVCDNLGLSAASIRLVVKKFMTDQQHIEFPSLSLLFNIITPITELR